MAPDIPPQSVILMFPLSFSASGQLRTPVILFNLFQHLIFIHFLVAGSPSSRCGSAPILIPGQLSFLRCSLGPGAVPRSGLLWVLDSCRGVPSS